MKQRSRDLLQVLTFLASVTSILVTIGVTQWQSCTHQQEIQPVFDISLRKYSATGDEYTDTESLTVVLTSGSVKSRPVLMTHTYVMAIVKKADSASDTLYIPIQEYFGDGDTSEMDMKDTTFHSARRGNLEQWRKMALAMTDPKEVISYSLDKIHFFIISYTDALGKKCSLCFEGEQPCPLERQQKIQSRAIQQFGSGAYLGADLRSIVRGIATEEQQK